MSNYLQFQSKLLLLILCFSLDIHPTRADSASKEELYQHTHPTILERQANKNTDYWSQANGQIEQLFKTAKNQSIELKNNKMPTLNSPIVPSALSNKISDIAKGFIYDPNHPGPFFDHLINGYTLLINIEKQVIPSVEKCLGDKNSLVISSKAKYAEQLQYLEALKQQRIMLDQSKPQK